MNEIKPCPFCGCENVWSVMKSTDTKPCPFCGCNEISFGWRYKGFDCYSAVLSCNGCDVVMSKTYHIQDYAHLKKIISRLKLAVTNEWNRRVEG